jgi:hypothetical protein
MPWEWWILRWRKKPPETPHAREAREVRQYLERIQAQEPEVEALTSRAEQRREQNNFRAAWEQALGGR